jgi:hypothetical protein
MLSQRNQTQLNLRSACYHADQSIFSPRLLSEIVNIKVYTTEVVPSTLYCVKYGI